MIPVLQSFWKDTAVYAGRVSQFSKEDWVVYVLWIGLMVGLFAGVMSFLLIGTLAGVQYPAYVWNIPLGTGIFVGAIAFDTIGHRTIYKEVLKDGEALVHHITILAGVTSVLALCLAYQNPGFMRFPALVLIALSIFYSAVDEAMHWHRYLTLKSDRIEMWSHFFILAGHLLMILAWWHWFDSGYPGVAETVAAIRGEA